MYSYFTDYIHPLKIVLQNNQALSDEKYKDQK